MRFSKNGCNGGNGKFFLEMVEKPGIGGNGKFLVYLYSWWRSNNPPILWRPPLYYLPLLPFQFLPPLYFLVTSNPHPHCSFCCPVSLAEWVIIPHLMCYYSYWTTHVETQYSRLKSFFHNYQKVKTKQTSEQNESNWKALNNCLTS